MLRQLRFAERKELPRKRKHEVPLSHAAAVCVLRKRQYIPLEIEQNTVGRIQFVDPSYHFLIPRVSALPQRREIRLHGCDLVVRNGVQHHVAVADLVGVVRALFAERSLRKRHPRLNPDRRRNADDLPRLEELLRAADAVVIDDPAGGESFRSCGVNRRRGRIGGERIIGMDVVVDHARVNGREFRTRDRALQRAEPLGFGSRVELV
ncbi:hypothetical protein SDC9_173419 [bioreactor metagenome]|uniref:Uncharacterized protein n=1 Tax=bioreactor metagenome TaxID=1076179 RepID=A0A645GGE8_9ZZZZ